MIFSIKTLGIKTLSIKTFSIKTISIKTLSIMTISIMTLSKKTIRIMTSSIRTLCITPLSIEKKNTTFSIMAFNRTAHFFFILIDHRGRHRKGVVMYNAIYYQNLGFIKQKVYF